MTTVPTLYSDDAERALIGAAIIDPAIINLVDTTADDFASSKNQLVWASIRRCVAKGLTPDIVTLTDDLMAAGDISKIGVSYLAQLINDTPTAYNFQSYAETVKGYSIRRQAVAAAQQIAKAAYDLDNDLSETIDNIIQQFSRANAPQVGARHISVALKTLIADVDARRANPSETWGYPTGILDFDALTGGLQPGEVMYIAGEPAAGKSKLSMQIATQIARSGVPTAIYSLEMGELQVIRRLVSAFGEIETRHLKTGKITDDEYKRMYETVGNFEGWPLYMSDCPTWTLDSLKADLFRLKTTYGVKVFMLDYLLLMGGHERLEESERAAKLSGGIKSLARSLGMAALTVNSVTKAGMDNQVASMTHVRGSGQTIHDADIIAQLFKPDKAGLASLVLTKTRDVASGNLTIQLRAEPKIPVFRSLSKREDGGQWWQK
jgi:replicative DNA helicase